MHMLAVCETEIVGMSFADC